MHRRYEVHVAAGRIILRLYLAPASSILCHGDDLAFLTQAGQLRAMLRRCNECAAHQIF
jgi:hypothetical protein